MLWSNIWRKMEFPCGTPFHILVSDPQTKLHAPFDIHPRKQRDSSRTLA